MTSPLQALWVAVGGFVGYLIADLVSGVFHWSVDNYGDGKTPVFGTVIEAFQGHHGESIKKFLERFRRSNATVVRLLHQELMLLSVYRRDCGLYIECFTFRSTPSLLTFVIPLSLSLSLSLNVFSWTAFPWTITHRPFENNVHKIAYAVLPLLALLKLADLGAAGVACGVTFLVGSLMSNVGGAVEYSCRIPLFLFCGEPHVYTPALNCFQVSFGVIMGEVIDGSTRVWRPALSKLTSPSSILA